MAAILDGSDYLAWQEMVFRLTDKRPKVSPLTEFFARGTVPEVAADWLERQWNEENVGKVAYRHQEYPAFATLRNGDGDVTESVKVANEGQFDKLGVGWDIAGRPNKPSHEAQGKPKKKGK